MTNGGARVHYEFDGFHLDIQQRLLSSGADRRPVPLPPKIFDTLLYMVERRGELLDKTTLLKAIWPNIVVEENSLNQNISALRRALGENPGEHRFIVTEPGRGYRFVADVRVAASTAAAPVTREAAQATATRSDALRKSVAVLPFANLTGDPGKDYFGDGLAEELIHKLARLPGLRVPSRTSSFAYKGRNLDVRQIARDLDVGVVLEGSVRSAGERLRVTAQLIDGHNGFHLWSNSYDRKFEDLFELQDEIAQAIVIALRITLDGARPAAGPERPTSNLEAYHLFLEATARQGAANFPDIAGAFAMFRRAIELDPGFARAYSQMAQLRAVAAIIGVKLPGTLADAEQEASKALDLDPTLAGGARAAVGTAHALQGRWLDADAGFRRAIDEDDTDPSARMSYAMLVLATAGYRQRYYETAQSAQRLAPAWVPVLMNVCVAAALLDHDEEGLATAQLALDLGATGQGPLADVIATLEARRGRLDTALQAHLAGALPVQRKYGGEDAVRIVYGALADTAQCATAARALDEFRVHLAAQEFSELLNRRMLYWYVQLGALDQAYALLNQSLERFAGLGMLGGAWGIFWLREMSAFRQDARFEGVVGRFGFMPYWERFGPPDGHELRGGRLICS